MALTVRPRQATGGTGVANFQRVRAEDTWAGGFIAPAIQRIEATAQAFVEEDANRKASGALLKAQGDFMAFQDSLRERQDYDKFSGDWEGFAEQWKAENLQDLNPLARAKIGDRIDQMVVQGTDQVRDRAWATQLDVSRADLLRFEEDAFRIVGQDPTGPTGQAALATYAERIDTMEAGGFLTAEQAEAQRQGAKTRYGSVAAVSLIDSDPYEAKRQLANGGFDQYLSPEKKLQLQGAADTEIKRREAEAKARQREAQAAYLAGFQDELAFVAAGNPVPDSQYSRDQLVAQLGAEQGGKLADAYERAAQTGQAALTIGTASEDEVRQILDAAKADMEAGPEGYQDKAATYGALVDAAKAREKGLAADPAAYVAQHFPAVGQAFEAYQQSGNVTDLQAATRLTMQLQADLGVPEAERRPLAKSAAASLASTITQAEDPEKQTAALAGVLQLGDDPTVRQVLAQLAESGAPAELAYAAQNLKNGDIAAATRILQAIATDAPKMPTGEAGKVFAEGVASAYEARQENLMLQGQWTGDPSRVLRAQSEAELIGRVAATSGNFDLATKDVAAGLQPVTDDRLAAVTAPVGVEPDTMLEGFGQLRDQLVTGEAFAAAIGPAGNTVAQKIGDTVAADVKGEARWVDYGEGYALVLPGQAYLAGADGKIRVFTLDDVVSAGTGGVSDVMKRIGGLGQ